MRLLSDMRNGAAASRRYRGQFKHNLRSHCAFDRGISGRSSDRLEGRRSQTDSATEASAKARTATARSLCAGDRSIKVWVRGGTLANGTRVAGAAQTEYPDAYADHLLRTLQRRLKIWRGENGAYSGFWPFARRGGRVTRERTRTGRITPQFRSDSSKTIAVLASIKDKPFGRPPKRPSLTAAAREGSAYLFRSGMSGPQFLRK